MDQINDPPDCKETNNRSLNGLYSRLIYQNYITTKKDERISHLISDLDTIFHSICSFIQVKLTSKLKTPINSIFLKYHEMELFINILDEIIPAKTKFLNILNKILDYGGIPGKFYNYIVQFSRQPLKKSKYIKRNLIPKNISGSFYTPGWISKFINLSAR